MCCPGEMFARQEATVCIRIPDCGESVIAVVDLVITSTLILSIGLASISHFAQCLPGGSCFQKAVEDHVSG